MGGHGNPGSLQMILQQPPLWLILIAFLCTIGPLVLIHELGHYLVARWLGVGAETFSIGFGREVAGWTDKRGTRWKIGWLPLGGYVKFIGDDNEASMPADEPSAATKIDPRNFHQRPVWQRFLIVLAGPAANFLLAIAVFAAFFALLGAPQTNVVGAIQPGSAAASAGLRQGDRIVAINSRSTETFDDIRSYVLMRPGAEATIRFERGGRAMVTDTVLGSEDMRDRFGQPFRRGLLGVFPSTGTLERVPVYRAIPMGAEYTLKLTRWMIDGLVQIIRGERSAKDIGGPIKIAQIAGQQATLGPLEFIQLIALISINLGFINLLPVPMLDGGHLFFYAVEAVRRRPLSARALEWAFRGGVAVILALLVFTTFNDLRSIGFWDGLQRLIG
jgi:regulator of sigma E protease